MLLDLPIILKTRRNHALEHACIHILSAKFPQRHFAGHSNPTGFFLLGNVSTQEVESAVSQAIMRLRAGESRLAIHAGCGTNLATTVLLSGGLAWLPLMGSKPLRRRLLLFPFAMVLALLGFVLSQPMGPWLQANVTTEANLGNLQVTDILPVHTRGVAIHRVITNN
jgi:hypothetical protein